MAKVLRQRKNSFNMVSASSLIPAQYGMVLASCTGVGFLLTWQTFLVGGARKRAQIPYPQLYATPEQQKSSKDALIFNCTQRSHQNTLENVPFLLFATLFNGLLNPKLAAGTMATWLVGRVIYTLGYTTGDPRKRNYGAMGSIALLVTLGTSAYSSYRVLVDGLF